MNVYLDAAGRRRLDLTGLGVFDPVSMTIKEGEVFYGVECRRKWGKRRFKVQVEGDATVKLGTKNGRTIVEVIAE